MVKDDVAGIEVVSGEVVGAFLGKGVAGRSGLELGLFGSGRGVCGPPREMLCKCLLVVILVQ